jgi:hypothetical protein
MWRAHQLRSHLNSIAISVSSPKSETSLTCLSSHLLFVFLRVWCSCVMHNMSQENVNKRWKWWWKKNSCRWTLFHFILMIQIPCSFSFFHHSSWKTVCLQGTLLVKPRKETLHFLKRYMKQNSHSSALIFSWVVVPVITTKTVTWVALITADFLIKNTQRITNDFYTQSYSCVCHFGADSSSRVKWRS